MGIDLSYFFIVPTISFIKISKSASKGTTPMHLKISYRARVQWASGTSQGGIVGSFLSHLNLVGKVPSVAPHGNSSTFKSTLTGL